MKIALIGYGKMGKAIERIAIDRGHTVPYKFGRNDTIDFPLLRLEEVIVIEFTHPESGEANVLSCLQEKIPIISGTTGWNTSEAKLFCLKNEGSFIHATNFSLGVNLFFEINTYVAMLMNNHNEYDVSINEVHHTAKKDAPSGTAITLAEGIMSKLKRKEKWTNEIAQSAQDLVIHSERIDPAPGTHYVSYKSLIDDIDIIHTAHTRDGFALGAVIAAEWLQNKKGVFTMRDVLFDS